MLESVFLSEIIINLDAKILVNLQGTLSRVTHCAKVSIALYDKVCQLCDPSTANYYYCRWIQERLSVKGDMESLSRIVIGKGIAFVWQLASTSTTKCSSWLISYTYILLKGTLENSHELKMMYFTSYIDMAIHTWFQIMIYCWASVGWYNYADHNIYVYSPKVVVWWCPKELEESDYL